MQGVCFGHQLIAHALGGKAGRAGCWGYGSTSVQLKPELAQVRTFHRPRVGSKSGVQSSPSANRRCWHDCIPTAEPPAIFCQRSLHCMPALHACRPPDSAIYCHPGLPRC